MTDPGLSRRQLGLSFSRDRNIWKERRKYSLVLSRRGLSGRVSSDTAQIYPDLVYMLPGHHGQPQHPRLHLGVRLARVLVTAPDDYVPSSEQEKCCNKFFG